MTTKLLKNTIRFFTTIEQPIELLEKLGILAIAFLAGALIGRLLVKRTCRLLCKNEILSLLINSLSTPTAILLGLVAVFTILPYLELPNIAQVNFLMLALRAITLGSILLWGMRVVDSGLVIWRNHTEYTEKGVPVGIIFIVRLMKMVLVILFFLLVLPSFFFGYTIIPALIKYASISTISAGAIVGLALQPVMKDFLGGFFVVSQGIFTQGDWIEINEGRRIFMGRVEEVNVRYTRLRRWTGSYFTVPNSMFLTSILDNFGRSHYTLYTLNLLPAEKGDIPLEKFLKGYRLLIEESLYIDEKSCHVTVKKLGVDKMEIDIHIYFHKARDEEKIIRIHDFWQQILHMAKKEKLPIGS